MTPPASEQVARRVHPAADVFPMLPEDELDELAADIKANGLVHPIVLDADGVLIDGRNRLEACRRAGVEPAYTTLNGHEPVAYIVSANVARRHLTQGQKAMAVARAGLFLGNSRQTSLADDAGVSQSRVAKAAIVLEYAPEQTEAVMAGASLNDAYEEAHQRKLARQSREAEAKTAARELARLRIAAPDLADLVTEERTTLREAFAALRQREDEERQNRATTTRVLATALSTLDPGGYSSAAWAAHFLDSLDPGPLPDHSTLTEVRLRACASVLTEMADQFAERTA